MVEVQAAMPPPQDTQPSSKRKRGRPPTTPTKGPAEKQIKASVANSHDVEDALVASTQDHQVAVTHLGTPCLTVLPFKSLFTVVTVAVVDNF